VQADITTDIAIMIARVMIMFEVLMKLLMHSARITPVLEAVV
jgi:hypothetical protein